MRIGMHDVILAICGATKSQNLVQLKRHQQPAKVCSQVTTCYFKNHKMYYFAQLVALLLLLAMIGVQGQEELPSTYEYFTEGGIQSGLTADTPGFFKLNGKDLRIVSGAIHYFRVHPGYWHDRLRKLRALGANTVETYVPWNLHEPEPDVFDFGGGGRDLSVLLDVRRFVQIAQEEDLLVLFRPGPYICSEWEYGGFPSWLQRDPYMKHGLRTAYAPYLDRVKKYFDALLPLVSDLQFTRGGAIIGLQIENEYGHFANKSTEYMEYIKAAFVNNGMGESLLFTSDDVRQVGDAGAVPGALITANLQSNAAAILDRLLEFQPNSPVMVAEFWAGWFTTWFSERATIDPEAFAEVFETILRDYNGSVNFYMFHGGTNFGFTAGASGHNEPPYYRSMLTSYDYDSPLTESGDYTAKFYRAMELIERYQVPTLRRPTLPPHSIKIEYSTLPLERYLNWYDILARVPSYARFSDVERPIPMELLDMNNGGGQGQGYIVYRKVLQGLAPGTSLQVGPVKDFGVLLVDGQIQPVPSSHYSPYWINTDLQFQPSFNNTEDHLIEVLVECLGRLNGWSDYDQLKGIPSGNISVDGMQATGFQILALELKSEWIRGLSNWRNVVDEQGTIQGPVMIQSTFTIEGTPADTFLDMRGWHKGSAFVNGFNLGRYFRVGPQQTLYVPAPLLRTGTNTVTIFEVLNPGPNIAFLGQPILDQY